MSDSSLIFAKNHGETDTAGHVTFGIAGTEFVQMASASLSIMNWTVWLNMRAIIQ